MPCGGRCRRNGLGVFGFNGRAPSIVAQCHSEGVLLQHLRLVAVVVPSQCGFRLRPMRGGCRRRCLVPNRRHAARPSRHPQGGRASYHSVFFLLPPSAGLPGAPVVPRQLFSLRKNSVIEIIRSPSLLVLERVVLAHQRLRVPAGMLRFTVSWRRASFTTSFLRFTRV